MGILSKKYYVLQKHLNISYSDFLIMPVYLRELLIDMLVEEKNPGS